VYLVSELKAKVRRLFEDGWNRGVLSVFDDLCAEGYVYRDSTYGTMDLTGYKGFVAQVRVNYPDTHVAIEDIMDAEGDTVVARWVFYGTDRGGSLALSMPPTNRKVIISGITICRFGKGKLVEAWNEQDTFGLIKQLKG
jgi:predicted ester cyclase